MSGEDDDDDLWKPRGLPFAEQGATGKREESCKVGGTFKRESSFDYSSWEIAFLSKKKRSRKR